MCPVGQKIDLTRARRSSSCLMCPAATSPSSARSPGLPSACSPPPPPGCSRLRAGVRRSCSRCWSTRRSRPPTRWNPGSGHHVRLVTRRRSRSLSRVPQVGRRGPKTGARSSVVLVPSAPTRRHGVDRSGTEAPRARALRTGDRPARARVVAQCTAGCGPADDERRHRRRRRLRPSTQGAELQQFLPGTLFRGRRDWPALPSTALSMRNRRSSSCPGAAVTAAREYKARSPSSRQASTTTPNATPSA